jgi:hypothetical protein
MHMTTQTALDLVDGLLEPAEVHFWRYHIATCADCTQCMADWQNLAMNLKRSHLEKAPSKDVDRALNIFTSVQTSRAGSALRQVSASVIFDSFRQSAFAGARGQGFAARQLVLRAEEFDIHIKIGGQPHHRQVVGQMLPCSGDEFSGVARLHLLCNGERLASTFMGDMGEFHFSDIPEGDLSLKIDLPSLVVIANLRTRMSDEL